MAGLSRRPVLALQGTAGLKFQAFSALPPRQGKLPAPLQRPPSARFVLPCGMGDRRKERDRTNLLFHDKATDEEGNLWEARIWKVPVSGRYREGVRYSLAFIRHGERAPAVLYDNHHPKGPHRHIGPLEEPYEFQDVDRLIADFRHDVTRVKG